MLRNWRTRGKGGRAVLTALLSEDEVCEDGSVQPQELMPELGSWTDSRREVRTSVSSNAMQGIRETEYFELEEILVHEGRRSSHAPFRSLHLSFEWCHHSDLLLWPPTPSVC
jgi:hypothetical protein